MSGGAGVVAVATVLPVITTETWRMWRRTACKMASRTIYRTRGVVTSQDTEEMASEIMVEVVAWWRRGHPPSPEVFRYAVSHAWRRLWPRRVQMVTIQEYPEDGHLDRPAHHTVEDRMAMAQQCEALARLDDALPLAGRHLLRRMLEGHELAEVAAELGEPLRVICVRWQRIRKHLADGTTPRERGPRRVYVPPPPEPVACACGCGLTWTRDSHRVQRYATEQCRWRAGQRRMAAKSAQRREAP